jgi:hypothetical protein
MAVRERAVFESLHVAMPDIPFVFASLNAGYMDSHLFVQDIGCFGYSKSTIVPLKIEIINLAPFLPDNHAEKLDYGLSIQNITRSNNIQYRDTVKSHYETSMQQLQALIFLM